MASPLGVGALPFLRAQRDKFTVPDAEPAGPDRVVLHESQTATLSVAGRGQAIRIEIGVADDIHTWRESARLPSGNRMASPGA